MLKKYPFIKQEELRDCAAASVLMIVKYYHGYITISKLREKLKITKNGTTAYHIVETLKELGFSAKGIKLEKLENQKTPFIAHVIINQIYKHYLVVYKVNKNYILIADPSSKIKKISHEKFYQMWTGIIITMYPKRPIIKEKPVKITKFLKKILSPYKIVILLIGMLSLIVTILSVVGSFFFQSLIDNVNPNKILLAFIISFTLQIITLYYRNKILIKFSNNLDYDLLKDNFKQIIKLPYLYYHNHTTGEVISRLNDLNTVNELIGKLIIIIFINLPMMILSGITLIGINNRFLLLNIFALFFYGLCLLIFHNKIKEYVEKKQKEKAQINSYMTESLNGFETIKGINIENQINQTFKKKYKKYIKASYKLDNIVNLQNLIKDFINAFVNVGTIIIGVYLIQKSIINISILITVLSLTNLFLESVKNIIDLDLEIKQSKNALIRVLELKTKDKPVQTLKGDIVFQNVNCTFDNINYVLKNINLIIKEKNKVLITGSSGSGKSTFLKIIKGYYEYQGIVKIGKENVKDISNIIYITPKELLFTGTIKDNLTIKDNKDLNKLIKLTCSNEIINSFDLGLNTLIEENGFNLSSGQKQRLALARSLYDFEILIIDEGLNSLNSNLERRVLKNLFNYYIDKTIIVVSHRIDNLDLFNQHIKLDKGRLVLNKEYNEKR